MTTLNITFNAETSGRFPVYCKYQDRYQEQPAYIVLDLETGECNADYNSEIGGTPEPIWNGCILTFRLSPSATADEIESIIENHAEEFQNILDGSSVEWDGSNWVGQLNEDALSICESLNKCSEGFWLDCNSSIIDNDYFVDWLQDGIYPHSGQTPEDFAEYLWSLDGEGDCYFSDDMNNPDSILSALRDVWAERLYAGYDLPKDVAQHLIEEGTCDDSQWMDELKEFANA